MTIIVCRVYTQVDYAVDVFKQLNPDDPDPEGTPPSSETNLACVCVCLLIHCLFYTQI